MRKKSIVEELDTAAADTASPFRTTLSVRALGWVSEAADQAPLYTICAATIGAGLATGKPGLARTGARMLASAWLATRMKSAIKHRIDRTRPHVVANGGRYQAKHGHDHASARNSFPSGHTAGAVAVARAIARDRPNVAGLAYGVAGAVAGIQVPRAQHYPSDLAVGALIGLAAEALVSWAESRTLPASASAVRP